ncbi:cytochrome P450 [Paraburkholderia caribensis]|uniref:cytochrome P450 n=1 Tax=Paraburkholderia caribensis TaxID=75105 RepID=UPI001CC81302|nr:cytochrome P450 [Paraburkholderia caribensis]
MADNALDIDFDDPQVLDNPSQIYARLQQEAPAYWVERRRTWVLTTHADVKAVSAMNLVFSSAHGLFWSDTVPGATGSRGNVLGPDLLFLSEPPRHAELRRILAPAFSPRGVARLQTQVEMATAQLLDELDLSSPIEWVSAVAKRLPTLLVVEILGLPREDESELRAGADALEAAIGYEHGQPDGGFGSLKEYIQNAFAEKRAHPDERLITTLSQLSAGTSVGETTLVDLVLTVIAGGNHTTRALLSGFAEAMAEHPDQYQLLRTRSDLIPSAIEECLRWVTPTRGHIRTALEDTTIPSGQLVSAGQRVYLNYHAANRDPAAFGHPNEFDISRESSKHQLAFGYGPRTCIAAPLVRSAMNIFIRQLSRRVESIKKAGPEVRVDTMLRSGWDQLTVQLKASA